MLAKGRRGVRRSRNPVPLLVILAAITFDAASVPAWAAGPGQWSDPNPPSQATPFVAIHMVLLPGDGDPFHFAVRPMDDNAQLSGFHPTALFQTFDIGCSGGGFSAHAARGDEDGAAASSLAASADATAQESATSALLVETRRTESGAWQVSVRRATAADGLDPAATGISIERDLASGDRERLGQVMAGESQTMLGICSLRERGRVAIPAGYRLERVLARVRHLAQDYALSSANHSRLGPLGGDFVARGGSVELLDGDVAELTYARSDGESESGSPWFLVVAREEVRTPAPTSRRPGLGERLPERFALHPNEPNPAVGSTRIRFDLPVTSAVKLEVFDLLGRKVVTLEHGQYPAGTHTSQWDLRDATGTMVRPGVYAYRLVAGPFRAHRKIGVRP